jgi:hypothetical protein
MVQPTGPLTQQDWSAWLLRSRDQLATCRRRMFIGGAVSGVGLATASQVHYPSGIEIAAGHAGKMDAFLQTLGVASFLGGGAVFLAGAQCTTYNERVVQGLEEEGRRRGFGSPQPASMGEREWLQRKAFLEGNAAFGRYIAIAGSLLMGAGGLMMQQYVAPLDGSGARVLGPGMAVFLIGYGTTIAGVALWRSNTRDAHKLDARPPAKTVAVQMIPRGRGMQGRVVIVF